MIAPMPMIPAIAIAPRPAIPPAEFPKRTIERIRMDRYFMEKPP